MSGMLLQAQMDEEKACVQACTNSKSHVRHKYAFTYLRHMRGIYTETYVSFQRILSASAKCFLLNNSNIQRARHIMYS